MGQFHLQNVQVRKRLIKAYEAVQIGYITFRDLSSSGRSALNVFE